MGPPLQGKDLAMRRITIIVSLGIACALLLPATLKAEDIYRWVDAAGTVHYGARPPDGVDAQRVDMPAAASRPAMPAQAEPPLDAVTPGPGAVEPLSPAEQSRQERAKKAEEKKLEKAALAGRCDAVREQLAEIEPHSRVIVKDEDGNVRRMEDQERVDLIQESKAFIAENCE